MSKRPAADIVRDLRQSADLTERLAVSTENSTRHRNEVCNARLMREAADRLEWLRDQIASGDIEERV